MYCAFLHSRRFRRFAPGSSVAKASFLAFLLLAASCQQIDDRAAHRASQQPQGLQLPPDQAWADDYERTMNPALGRPTPEITYALREERVQMVKQWQSNQKIGSVDQWTALGPNNIGGRTRALLWDPTDATGKKVWAGAASGGLWYNNDITNANSSWVAVNDFWENLAVSCIAADPTNPQVWYVGTGESVGSVSAGGWVIGAGVWKTTDAGASWERLTSTDNYKFVNDIVVRNEGGVGVVYLGTNESNFVVGGGGWLPLLGVDGLYRSINGGTSWNRVSPLAIADLEIGADNRLYAGTTNSGTVAFSDNGTSWTETQLLTNGQRVELAVAPSNANRVYAVVEEDNTAGGIYRSNNKGENWIGSPTNNTLITEPIDPGNDVPDDDFTRGQAWYDLIAQVDPNNADILVVGGINLHRSTNAGLSWSRISDWTGNDATVSVVHADQHQILFKPGSSNQVIFGHDGGVSYTSNFSASPPSQLIENRNRNYITTQFYAGAVGNNAANPLIIGGTQDNGSPILSSNSVGNGIDVAGGDGGYASISPTEDLQVTAYTNNQFVLWRNRGTTGIKNPALSTDGRFINPADVDWTSRWLYSLGNSSAEGMFVRVSDLNGTTRNSTTFKVADRLASTTERLTTIHVSPATTATNSIIFVATTRSRVFRITNANNPDLRSVTLVADASSGLPGSAHINCIAFGETANHIILVYSNYGITSIFDNTNGGTGTWTAREGNLPDLPIRWLVTHPQNAARAWVATEMGVYRTNDFNSASPTWTVVPTGFANVRVDMLRVRPVDNTLYAFTHGRGVYYTQLPSATAVPPATPVATAATQTGPSGFQANWNSAANATGYALEVVTAANGFANKSNLLNAQGQLSGARPILVSGTNEVVFALPANTAYKYRLRAYAGSDTSAYSNEIDVTTATAATASIVINSLGSTVCSGESITVNYSTTGSITASSLRAQLSNNAGSFVNAPVTVSGTAGVGADRTLTIAIPSGTPTGAGYRVRLLSTQVVVTSAQSASFSINAAPASPTGIAGLATAYCVGATVTLTATPAPSGANNTYQWILPDGWTSANTTGASITVTVGGATGSRSIGIRGTNTSTNCQGLLVNVPANVVPVVPTPTIQASGNTALCTGGTVTLSVTNVATGVSYEWYRNGTTTTLIGNSLPITYTDANQLGSYTARAVVAGCNDASNAVAVTAGAAPSPTISAPAGLTICPGSATSTVLLTAANTGGGSIQWLRNNVALAGETGTTLTVRYAGDYRVRATTTCPGVSAAVTVSFGSGGTPPTVQNNSGTLSLPNAYATYQWNYRGTVGGQQIRGLIVGATAATYTPPANGEYSVTVTTAAGCRLTSNFVSIVNLAGSAEPVQLDNEQVLMRYAEPTVSVYPNPANDYIEIGSNGFTDAANVSLTDLRGANLVRRTLGQLPQKRIAIGGYPNGLYVVRVQEGNKVVTQRIAIQH